MIFELDNYMINFLKLVFKNIFQILSRSNTINIMKGSCQHFGYFVGRVNGKDGVKEYDKLEVI